MADVILINVEEGSKRVMGNSKLYAKLIAKFKNDAYFNTLDAAITAGDIEKAKITVHTLKGLTANLSFDELNKQIQEIETQLKAGSVNPDKIAAVRDIYDQTMIEADKVIAQYA